MEIRAEGVKKGENNLNKKDGMNIIWIYIYLYFRVQEKSLQKNLKKDQLWNLPPPQIIYEEYFIVDVFQAADYKPH